MCYYSIKYIREVTGGVADNPYMLDLRTKRHRGIINLDGVHKLGKVNIRSLGGVGKSKKFCLAWNQGHSELLTVVFSDCNEETEIIKVVSKMDHVICLAHGGYYGRFNVDSKTRLLGCDELLVII